MTQLSTERSRGIWEIWIYWQHRRYPIAWHHLPPAVSASSRIVVSVYWAMKPREPVFIRRSQAHTAAAVFEAQRASSLITHPSAARVCVSVRRDSVGTDSSDAIKAQQAWGATSDPIVVFHPKIDSDVHSEKPAVGWSPEEPDNETPHTITHSSTYIVRIETLKQ